ncbi:hypothetical protein PM082_018616 [Marasmius tenuissimus]|nr:hypothetical protein PM082_018616 [Marasmius tenuissimus]
MKLSAVFAILAITATGALAQQCSGNAKANQRCVGTGDCGDAALGLCGSAGFVCQSGVCRKKPGVYCVDGAGECQTGSNCISGRPTVGKDYGPRHCS